MAGLLRRLVLPALVAAAVILAVGGYDTPPRSSLVVYDPLGVLEDTGIAYVVEPNTLVINASIPGRVRGLVPAVASMWVWGQSMWADVDILAPPRVLVEGGDAEATVTLIRFGELWSPAPAYLVLREGVAVPREARLVWYNLYAGLQNKLFATKYSVVRLDGLNNVTILAALVAGYAYGYTAGLNLISIRIPSLYPDGCVDLPTPQTGGGESLGFAGNVTAYVPYHVWEAVYLPTRSLWVARDGEYIYLIDIRVRGDSAHASFTEAYLYVGDMPIAKILDTAYAPYLTAMWLGEEPEPGVRPTVYLAFEGLTNVAARKVIGYGRVRVISGPLPSQYYESLHRRVVDVFVENRRLSSRYTLVDAVVDTVNGRFTSLVLPFMPRVTAVVYVFNASDYIDIGNGYRAYRLVKRVSNDERIEIARRAITWALGEPRIRIRVNSNDIWALHVYRPAIRLEACETPLGIDYTCGGNITLALLEGVRTFHVEVSGVWGAEVYVVDAETLAAIVKRSAFESKAAYATAVVLETTCPAYIDYPAIEATGGYACSRGLDVARLVPRQVAVDYTRSYSHLAVVPLQPVSRITYDDDPDRKMYRYLDYVYARTQLFKLPLKFTDRIGLVVGTNVIYLACVGNVLWYVVAPPYPDPSFQFVVETSNTDPVEWFSIGGSTYPYGNFTLFFDSPRYPYPYRLDPGYWNEYDLAVRAGISEYLLNIAPVVNLVIEPSSAVVRVSVAQGWYEVD